MSVVWALIMGKEQDLLVAVKSGDLLLAHKLLSKVKCNKTSEYGSNRAVGFMVLCFLISDFVFVVCSGPESATDPSLSSALEHKWANQRVAFASSERGPTTTQLCSNEIYSDFCHFQAGSVGNSLVKRHIWSTFKSDACYSVGSQEVSFRYLSKIKC